MAFVTIETAIVYFVSSKHVVVTFTAIEYVAKVLGTICIYDSVFVNYPSVIAFTSSDCQARVFVLADNLGSGTDHLRYKHCVIAVLEFDE